ncbi:DUF998 domain-containing protein [Cellulomonas sp. URHE0023]|uniref:DUF998 domain-containing protein n=1 Tax=Cellulomonas sp. URHE0023 TaxID=1380354 RepID=UPI000480D3B0|nr:DUF998 domain-containing protein [Cellulomonas sp. URHE0023]
MTVVAPQPVTTPRRSITGTRLVRIATVSALGAGAAIVVAGLLDPGYSARSEAISALASQESHSAALMIGGFVLMASTLLASGAFLFSRLAGKAGRTGSVLVVLAGLLTLVAGFNRQDCSNLQAACLAREEAETVSSQHVIHNLVSIPIFLFLIVAAFFLAAGLRRWGRDTALARATVLAGVAGLVLAVWFGSEAYGSNGGLVECALVLVTFGWPALVANRVLSRDALAS